MPAAFLTGVVLLYLPYWWSAGAGVVGYARELAEKEGYVAGYGFHVIWLLRDYGIADPPAWLYLAFALTLLGALALFAFFAREREEIRPATMVALSFAFIWLTSPHHVWYFGWIIPLLCRHLSPAALAMTLLCLLRYAPLDPPWITASSVYLATFGAPLLILAGGWLWRRRQARAAERPAQVAGAP